MPLVSIAECKDWYEGGREGYRGNGLWATGWFRGACHVGLERGSKDQARCRRTPMPNLHYEGERSTSVMEAVATGAPLSCCWWWNASTC